MTSEITETEAHRIAVKIATSGKSGRVHQMAYEAAKAGALAALAARPAPEAGSGGGSKLGTWRDLLDLIQAQAAQIASLSAKVAELERERDEADAQADALRTAMLRNTNMMNDRAKAAEARASELQREVERLERERDEARAYADLGCESADGGPHHVMTQGSYRFCGKCGITIRTPTLRERARKAEARTSELERKVERLEESYTLAWNQRDAQRRRAEKAEARAALQQEGE